MKEVWFSEIIQITFSILSSLTYGLFAKNRSEKLKANADKVSHPKYSGPKFANQFNLTPIENQVL